MSDHRYIGNGRHHVPVGPRQRQFGWALLLIACVLFWLLVLAVVFYA